MTGDPDKQIIQTGFNPDKGIHWKDSKEWFVHDLQTAAFLMNPHKHTKAGYILAYLVCFENVFEMI